LQAKSLWGGFHAGRGLTDDLQISAACDCPARASLFLLTIPLAFWQGQLIAASLGAVAAIAVRIGEAEG
jgi:hypothetical protein